MGEKQYWALSLLAGLVILCFLARLEKGTVQKVQLLGGAGHLAGSFKQGPSSKSRLTQLRGLSPLVMKHSLTPLPLPSTAVLN